MINIADAKDIFLMDTIRQKPLVNIVKNGTDTEIDRMFYLWARGYLRPVCLERFIFELTESGEEILKEFKDVIRSRSVTKNKEVEA